jgi:hypothetical protein
MPRRESPLKESGSHLRSRFHLRTLYGWYEMDPMEQHFFAAYMMFQDSARTARFVGKEPEWATELLKTNGQFEGNLTRLIERLDPSRAVRFYEEEWLGQRAMEVMKGATQVNAAKYLLDRIYPRKRGRPQTTSANGKAEEPIPELDEGLGLGFLDDD